MEEFKAIASLLDNFGAIAILGILIYKLPSILHVMNESKKELATAIKDMNSESLKTFAEALRLIQEKSDAKHEKVEVIMEKICEQLDANTKAIEQIFSWIKFKKQD